jgi:site-specific DNA-methyltransferase (adenine-specific)
MYKCRWDGFIKDSDEPYNHHPTPKPVAVMAWCLSFFPDIDSVIDPFCGGGSTLIAAKKQNLRAIGIEIEEKYCEIAAKRLSQEVFDFTSSSPEKEQEP